MTPTPTTGEPLSPAGTFLADAIQGWFGGDIGRLTAHRLGHDIAGWIESGEVPGLPSPALPVVTVTDEMVERAVAAYLDTQGAPGQHQYEYRAIAMRAALVAALSAAGGGWTQDLPKHQALYWHWSGDEDDAPIPLNVHWSGTDNKTFVTAGQYGLTHAILCADYGGWWMPCPTPQPPMSLGVLQ